MIIQPPQFYPVVPGLFFAGEYPGHRDAAIARDRLGFLAETGVRLFIDLTTGADGLAPYTDLLGEAGTAGLTHVAHPVFDMDVPGSPEVMRAILETIRTALDQDRPVYLHCWGGIGRTGTVVGCWLREQGLPAVAALAKVQRLYQLMPKSRGLHRHSPQTIAQRDYIRHWPSALPPQPAP